MLNYTEVVFGNGLLSDTELDLCFKNLPLRGTPPVSPESPCYIVGLVNTKGAEGIGAWVDGNTLYLDPVCLVYTLEKAAEIAQEHQQAAVFKMTGVSEEKEVVSDTIEPVLYYLRTFSDQYGGATAVFVGYTAGKPTYRVIAGEGEVIYL
jgi:hypothetical protein